MEIRIYNHAFSTRRLKSISSKSDNVESFGTTLSRAFESYYLNLFESYFDKGNVAIGLSGKNLNTQCGTKSNIGPFKFMGHNQGIVSEFGL